VRRVGPTTVSAESEQIVNTFDFINRLLAGDPKREEFQKYARSILRPAFDQLGWEPKASEFPSNATLRPTLIRILGDLNDTEIIAGCRERFAKFLADRSSLPPDLRPAVFAVVGRYADEATWNQLHELGRKTTSIEEKGICYDALAEAIDPKLAEKTMALALTDELPTSRALFLVSRVARDSERPDVGWDFAKAHMKELLSKTDALGANSYIPALFTTFSDEARIGELENYAKTDLPPEAAKQVEKAKDELGFRAEFRKRLLAQIPAAFARPAKVH
jgi:hypothetical protein